MTRLNSSCLAHPSPARLLNLFWVSLLLATHLVSLSGMAASQAESLQRARQHIDAFQEEKAQRSPAQRKVDSQLLFAARQHRGQAAVRGIPPLRPAFRQESDGRVMVDIRATVNQALLDAIQQNGGTLISHLAQYRAIRAIVPLTLVEQLASRPEVNRIRPAVEAITNTGSVTSGGDITHRADTARDAFRVDGTGVKIGVLSDSATFLFDSQRSGDLPEVTVLPGQFGYGSGEGTAMLEILHDLSPGAELYFATAFTGEANFAQNIRNLYAAGCRIIVDDVTYLNESPFQDGPIARAVNDISAGGAMFFSSAGNSGNKNDGTAGTWEGDFVDGGLASLGRGGRLHDFGGSTYNTVLPGGSLRRVDFFWADPLGGSANDYDVYVLNPDGSVAASSSNVQDGDDDPYEVIYFTEVGQRVVIVKYSGEDRYLHLSAGRAVMEFSTPGATRGHNASGAENAFSVAATWIRSPVVPFTGGPVNPVELFSSDGPRRMYFHPDGTPITPGDFSASGGMVLQKPDITAADGVATTVPGFEQFFGTSASAPHAAAIAALIWSYNPGLTPQEVRQALAVSALDIEEPGVDRDSGVGIAMAGEALSAAPPPPPRLFLESVQLVDGNGNGLLDANECGELWISLLNLIGPSGDAASEVTAVLHSESSEIIVDPTPQAFPNILPGTTGANLTPFRLSTTPGYTCGFAGAFELHVTTANAGTFVLPFNVSSTPPAVGVAIDYLSTNAPLTIPDLGMVESTLSVSGMDLPLAKVTVSLHAAHPYDSDLQFTLIAPDGTEVDLTSNNGGSGMDYGTSCTNLTQFDDNALLSITVGTAPFLGAFRPEKSLAVLNGKSGEAVNGAWRLRAADTAEMDTGLLQCWGLQLHPIACLDGGGQCLEPPAITQHPQTILATNEDTVEFNVQATGSEPLFYQWYFNRTNPLPAATEAVLALSHVTPNQNGAYSVVVSNLYGTAASEEAQLTVVVPPQIVQQPQDQIATNGFPVAFIVEAAGTPPLDYQWFYNVTNPLPEATNNTFVLTQVSPDDAGQYSVRVRSAYGEAVSEAASLTVFSPPVLLAHPQDLIVFSEETAVFSVMAEGTAPLDYQWYFNETEPLAGAKSATLELLNVSMDQAGGYSVVVSNAYGTATSKEAELQVIQTNASPTVVLTSPAEGAIFLSNEEPIQMSATAVDPDGAIQLVSLLADGQQLIQFTSEPFEFTWIDAHIGPQALQAIALDNEGRTATSAVVNITVYLSANPGSLIATGSVWKYLDTGTNLGIDWRGVAFDDNAWASGPAQLGYGDGDEATEVSFGPDPQTKFTTTYFRRSFVLTDAESFTNLALNVLRDDGAVVYLNEVEVFRSNLPEGEIAFTTFAQSAASGAAERNYFPATVNPGLLVNGANVIAVEIHQANLTSSDISFDLSLSGFRYSAPRILAQPGDQAVDNGASAEFAVAVTGAKPLEYQWIFNRTNRLDDATNASLVLGSVGVDQSGEYAVLASNAFGSVLSDAGILTVLLPNELPTVSLSGPAHGAIYPLGSSIPLAATASDPDGSIAQVEFSANGIALTQVTGPPFVFHWLDAAAGIYDLQAVAVDNRGATATSSVVQIEVQFSTNLTQLIPTGAAWRYLDTGVDLGAEWKQLEYEDHSWASGPAQLGYGDGDEATVVEFGSDPGNKYVTTYFRHAFVLTDPAAFAQLKLRLLRDDGGIVYLNEEEIFRSNMPAGQIGFNTLAAGVVGGADESTFFEQPVLPGWLRHGTNILAVEIHQANLDSSDISFDLELLAERFSAPVLLSQPQPLTVNEEATATFYVEVFGTAPLGFQWFFNQTNALVEETNASLVLTNISTNQAGDYSVEVQNALGRITSDLARLTVVVASNQPPTVAITAPLAGATLDLSEEPFVLTAEAADTDGAVDRVEFFADGNRLFEDTEAPYRFDWLGASVGHHELWAVATDNDGASATSAVTQVTVTFTNHLVQLVPAGANWRYLDTGTSPETNWLTADFDDSTWSAGPAQLGYGDDDEATVVSFGPDTANKYITTYFRQAFVLGNSLAYTNLTLELLRDDGAVVYLNEEEIFRSNMPTGAVAFNTLAAATVSGADETTFHAQSVLIEQLQPGANILAVEVHQIRPTSSDISFDLALMAERLTPPMILAQPESQTISRGASASFIVEAAGTAPLAYQWFFNQSTPLAGQTNALLVFPNATVEDVGDYSATISNAWGSVTSQIATLTVLISNTSPTVTIISPTNGSPLPSGGESILVEAFATDPDGNVVRVDLFADNTPLVQLASAPYRFAWLDAPLGIHTLLAVAQDEQGAMGTSEVATIQVVLSPEASPFVSWGANWKYRDTGEDLGADWQRLIYDDQTWSSGPAELGYGDASEGRPEATVISYGPEANDKYITTYFRHEFQLTATPLLTNLQLQLLCDDGAVVYLNDEEVFRANLPEGAIAYTDQALQAVGGDDETNYLTSAIPLPGLRLGQNLLAVEVHQVSPTSSDISFDLTLLAERVFAPLILVNPTSLTVNRGESGTFTADATGSEPLAYQWYFNQTLAIPEATNLTLALQDIQPAWAGAYSLRASNEWGAATSAPALLTVLTPDNRPPLVSLDTPANGDRFEVGVSIPFTARATDPDGTVAQVGFIANGELLALDEASPYEYTWENAPAGIHALWAIAIDNLGDRATSEVANILVSQSTQSTVTLVSTGAVWKYLDTGVDQQTAWRAVDFDDAQWLSGPAELGYGDDSDGRPEATVLSFGPDDRNKYPTYYFRHSFVLTRPGSIEQLRLGLLRDDGAIVYLNGTEVFRSNMPDGEVPYDSYASSTVSQRFESTYYPAEIPIDLLVEGTNVLAVELHQINRISSDISFDLELEGRQVNPPTILVQPQDTVATNGETALFEVMASGAPPLSFQWYWNVTNRIPNATNAQLVLPAVSTNDAGIYLASVSNPGGTVFSDSANLTVFTPIPNTPPTVRLTSPTNHATFLEGDAISFSAQAEDVDGDVTQVDYFDGSQKLGSSMSPPYVFDWIGATVGAHSLWALASDDRGATNASDLVEIEVIEEVKPPTPQVSLISTGSVWKYLDTGEDQGQDWLVPEFDDSQWNSGPAELGYGDEPEDRPETTLISFGADPDNKIPTYYFRHMFSVINAALFSELHLRLQRDDGARVYLNGTEVFRDNLPDGEISFTDYALAAVGKEDEYTFLETPVSTALLREGANWVAVEIHQANATSSDISFDLELTATQPLAPVIVSQPQSLIIVRGQTARFDAQAVGEEPLVYQWYLNGLIPLSDATNATLTLTNAQFSDEGSYSVTITNAAGTTRSDGALLQVLDTPQILSQPQNVTLNAGGTAQFNVTALGTEPLSYQWYFDGIQPLSGETGPILLLPIVTPSQSGNYTVEVSNPVGSILSDPAVLRVLVPVDSLILIRDNEGVTLSFPTLLGLRYTVDYRDSVDAQMSWSLLPGAIKLNGTGDLMTIPDPGAVGVQRFYRVRVE